MEVSWVNKIIRQMICRRAFEILEGDWTTKGSEFESRYGQEFSLLHVVQTGSGAHPASYPMVPGALSPG
jgi:hypothetical protein